MIEEELGVESMIDALIEREGGYSNHPADKGGPTCFGITEAVARAHGYAGAMRNLPRDEAVAGTDGDGRMIGWILVYASVVIVLAALALWERSP